MSLTPSSESAGTEAPRVFRVSELNSLASRFLERTFGWVSVTGEVSGWMRHRSGHCYFTLKDANAELRCVCFQSRAARHRVLPEDGMDVLVRGRLTIYVERGAYQLVAEHIRPAGAGALLVAFERLKTALAAEGLFADERKRALPRIPRTVGVVTSPDGAAFADIRRVLTTRWPDVSILLSPTAVQGDGAAAEIRRALERHVAWGVADVLIIGRGGGSMEDLWAFNDEALVRAIAACPIPVISAVGHETDTTLSDLVADVRASTPSRAAEIAVPDRAEVLRVLSELRTRLRQSQTHAFALRRSHLRALVSSHGLHRPRGAVESAMQRVDRLSDRLSRAGRALVTEPRRGLVATFERLTHASTSRLDVARRDVRDARVRLGHGAMGAVRDRRPALSERGGRLAGLDPTRVLARGYSLCAGPEGTLVRDAASLSVGDELHLRFHRGAGTAVVSTVRPQRDEGDTRT